MEKPFLTIDDVDVKGKRVLLRVDMNSPLENGKIASTKRIERYLPTIKELVDNGAKVVVIAHQGRPGRPDFISLQQHAKALSKLSGLDITFVDDIIGSNAIKKINEMKDGDVLVLENVRFLAEETLKKSEEEHAQSLLVRRLAPLFDIFVSDAYYVAHRSHASVVGFSYALPSIAGRVMEEEAIAIDNIVENPERPSVLILGGVKAEDSIRAMENMLLMEKADYVLTCGVIAVLFLAADGCDVGLINIDSMRKLEVYGLLPRAKALIKRYPEKIKIPIDVAVHKEGKRVEVSVSKPINHLIMDIGKETIREYSETIKQAKTVCYNGPAGVFENPDFGDGTIAILKAMKENRGFTLLGGGHTVSAMEKLGFNRDDFSYVSLAGGAMMMRLAGEELPGVKALKIAKEHMFR